MKSKPVAMLLADLGVTKTHSRPYTSDDNPYSEAQFKTLKYRPEFPDRFGSIEDARSFCQRFFFWYNNEHRHTGIGLLTPEMVHYGRAQEVITARKEVLRAAYQKHPERFVLKEPSPQPLPEAVWINPPKAATSDGKLHKIQPAGVSKPLTDSGLMHLIVVSKANPGGVISTERSIAPPRSLPACRVHEADRSPTLSGTPSSYSFQQAHLTDERFHCPSTVGKSDYSPNWRSSPVRTCANSSPPTRRGTLYDSRGNGVQFTVHGAGDDLHLEGLLSRRC